MVYMYIFVAVLSVCCYWIYKKIRAPLYQPGMVASNAQKDPQTFDNDLLYSQSTSTSWRMPNDVNIFVFEPLLRTVTSTPPRAVLAIHGGPSIAPSEPWKLCQQVSNVYLYHARGCGHSTRIFSNFPTKGLWPGMKILEEHLGIGAQVADVERIRRRLGCGQKIDLIGHSFGGLIATMYACEFPEHVRSLTLLVPASVLILPAPKGTPDFFAVVGDKIRQIGNPKYIAEYESFQKRYFDFSSLPRETDESLAKRHMEFAIHYARAEGKIMDMERNPVEAGLTGGMACYANFLSLGMEHDYTSVCKRLLAQSEFPVSIVHGENDLMPESTTRQYAELFPSQNVTWEVIPDEAHFLFDHPRVADIVKETMDRVIS